MDSAPPTYTIRTPLFGTCTLIPHSLDEAPTGVLAYVEYADRPGSLDAALYKDGKFCGRNLKPLSKPIARWYSVVREDGSQLF